MYIRKIVVILSVFALTGCIDEFTPKGVEEIRGILVVEGHITEGNTVITLSRTGKLSDPDFIADIVDNAVVYVESDDGERYEACYEGDGGTYHVPVPSLNKDKQYRLHILMNDGKEYCSEYLNPLVTPEIDRLYYTKKKEGDPVFICVDTEDKLNQSRYYRWSYKENWEVKANYFAEVGRVGKELVHYSFDGDNIYYCWGQNASSSLILGTTDKLSENVIREKRIQVMEPSDDRLSELYHIEVEQLLIRKEAFDYFNNLQKNVDSGHSLFAPMPIDMKGNIICLNDPDAVVLGYIEVTTTVVSSIYIDESAQIYERPYKFCPISEDVNDGLYIFSLGPPPLYSKVECFDCRTKWKATKVKPDWWPTDNI